jgi:hypothetical protein
VKIKVTWMDRNAVVIDDIDETTLNSDGTVLCIYRLVEGTAKLASLIPLNNVREVQYLP